MQSASAKDIRRDKEIDARLKDPPPLPPHLKDHQRKPSRVDVEVRFLCDQRYNTVLRSAPQMLYADSPIDASLLSLYIHQNYTQYCNTLEECDALADSLSRVDASGGETVCPIPTARTSIPKRDHFCDNPASSCAYPASCRFR